MGKMLSSSSLNIDIGSTSQFPEYESNHDLPALASNVSERSEPPGVTSKSAGPSYSTVI